MKRSGKILLYSLYTIAAICVFLYLLFPSDTASELVMAQLAKMNKDIQVDIKETNPVFPPGLKFQPLDISYSSIPVLRMDQLKIMPSLFSMLGAQKEVAFKGILGTGEMKGRAEIMMENQRPQTILNINLTKVPVNVFEVLDLLPGYQVMGDVTSYINYDSTKGAGGTANIKLGITPAKIVFNQALMGLEQLDFSEIDSEITVTPRMIQIKRCEMTGNQIDGKVSGSIIFRRPFTNSRLTLSCTIKPQPGFLDEQKNTIIGGFLGTASAQKRGIVLRISGTVGRPKYVVR